MLDIVDFRKRVGYHPDGYLFFKKSPRASYIGKRMGTGKIGAKGYIDIRYGKRSYKEHRLIFFYHYGYMPPQIDHINRVRHDNRIENLREATPLQNSLNRGSTRKSKSKYKCVYLTEYGTWKGEVKIHLGEDTVITTKSYSQEEHAAFYVDVIMLEWYGVGFYCPNLKHSETHIWDESFERLLTEGKHLIPYGFRERILKDASL